MAQDSLSRLTILTRDLRRLVGLPLTAWPTAIAVGAMALVIEVGIRVIGVRRLGRALAVSVVREPRRDPSPAEHPQFAPAQRRAVRLALRLMRRWPWGKGACLRQSLLIGWILRDHRPVVRLGVRRRDGQLQAHAWVDAHGVIIGEMDDFAAFEAS